jgi:Holliday junction resolvasome RuvABC endonuclease subunit
VKVSGLDLSMTETGVAYTCPGAPFGVETMVIHPREKRDLRLPEIASRVIEAVADSDLVLIEGYLNRSMSAGITGMVHGAVRAALIEAGLKYGTLPPASLKKFATGRGNATKTDMALAALKRGELEFRNDNQCDAWWLWVAANQHLWQPLVQLPKSQRDALVDKIQMEG